MIYSKRYQSMNWCDVSSNKIRPKRSLFLEFETKENFLEKFVLAGKHLRIVIALCGDDVIGRCGSEAPPALGQFTLNRQCRPTAADILLVFTDQCVTLSASVDVGWHLFLPTEHVESAFVGLSNVSEVKIL